MGSAGMRDNALVGQLSMFTRAETAAMRDRTARRNYSPAAEAFRREHERHRSWGKAVRHAGRIRQLGEASIAAQAGMTPDELEAWGHSPWPAASGGTAPRPSVTSPQGP